MPGDSRRARAAPRTCWRQGCEGWAPRVSPRAALEECRGMWPHTTIEKPPRKQTLDPCVSALSLRSARRGSRSQLSLFRKAKALTPPAEARAAPHQATDSRAEGIALIPASGARHSAGRRANKREPSPHEEKNHPSNIRDLQPVCRLQIHRPNERDEDLREVSYCHKGVDGDLRAVVVLGRINANRRESLRRWRGERRSAALRRAKQLDQKRGPWSPAGTRGRRSARRKCARGLIPWERVAPVMSAPTPLSSTPK